MKHFTEKEWLLYVQNQLQQDKQSELEDHLYNCDQCLSIYLDALQQHEKELPHLSDDTVFTDIVMEQVQGLKQDKVVSLASKTITRKKPFYQKAMFHYVLAAAMTFLLMATGVFQSLTNYVDTVQSSPINEPTPSVTEGIIDKTFAWMDTIQQSKEEANQ